jgi:hypothetical protein
MEIHKWGPERDQMVSYWVLKRIRPEMPPEEGGHFEGMVRSSRTDLPATILLEHGPGDYVLVEQSDPSGMTPMRLGKYGLSVRFEWHSDLVPLEPLFSTPSAESKSSRGRPLDEKITKAVELRDKKLRWVDILRQLEEGFDSLSKADQQQRTESMRSAVSKRRKKPG